MLTAENQGGLENQGTLLLLYVVTTRDVGKSQERPQEPTVQLRDR